MNSERERVPGSMKTALTILGFAASIVLLAMAAIMIVALNLVLNGYHRECGIWENAIPFMCSPKKEAPPVRSAPAAKPKKPGARTAAVPKEPAASPCAPLQQEPYRVQCDPGTGACYHDPGFRARCGLADNWKGVSK